MIVKTIISIFVALLSHSNKNTGEAINLKNLIMLGKTNITKPITGDDWCSKEQFIRDYVTGNKPLTNTIWEDLQRNCTNLSTHLKCKAAGFTLYYVERSSEFFYYIEIDGLNDTTRNECWGYLLRVRHDSINETRFIGFKTKQTKHFGDLYTAVPSRMFSIDLITFPTGIYPIGGKAELRVKSPSACENDVLILLNKRIAEAQSNCTNEVNPNLNQRIKWSTMICDRIPLSRALRKSVVHQAILTNCTTSFKQLLVLKTKSATSTTTTATKYQSIIRQIVQPL